MDTSFTAAADFSADGEILHWRCLQCVTTAETLSGIKEHMKSHASPHKSSLAESSLQIQDEDQQHKESIFENEPQDGLASQPSPSKPELKKRGRGRPRKKQCNSLDSTSEEAVKKVKLENKLTRDGSLSEELEIVSPKKYTTRIKKRINYLALDTQGIEENKTSLPKIREEIKREPTDHPTGVQHIKCTQCGYIARTSHGLNRHLRVHVKKTGLQGSLHLTEEAAAAGDAGLNQTSATVSPEILMHKSSRKGKRGRPKKLKNLKIDNDEGVVNDRSQPIQCSACEKTFMVLEDLRKHVNDEHNFELASNQCPVCKMPNKSRNSLALHIREIHQHAKVLYRCMKCDYTTRRVWNLERHNQVNAHTGQYCCSEEACGYRSSTTESLKLHLSKMHTLTDEELDSYEFTKITSQQKSKLKEEGDTLECDICKKLLHNKATLRAHLRDVHDDGCDEYICEQCPYKAKRFWNLRRHIKEVHEGSRLQCMRCGYITKAEAKLKQHEAKCTKRMAKDENMKDNHTHAVVLKSRKMKVCEVCGFTTDRRDLLERHMLNHDPQQIKLITCQLCDYKAISKAHLRLHMLKHRNAQRHLKSCHLCEGTFVNMAAFKLHLNEKHSVTDLDFCCQECGELFVDAKSFRRHQDTHHVNVSYFCVFCDYKSSQKSDITQHYNTEHPDGDSLPQLEEVPPHDCIGAPNEEEIAAETVKSASKEDTEQIVTVQHTKQEPEEMTPQLEQSMVETVALRKLLEKTEDEQTVQSTSKNDQNQHTQSYFGSDVTCKDCGQQFSLRARKRKLMPRSTGQNPSNSCDLQCGYCSEKFTMWVDNKGNMLQKHLESTHQDKAEKGEVPFRAKCCQCDDVFEAYRQVRNHCRVFHNLYGTKDLYVCDLCGYTNTRRYNVLRHRVCMHMKTEHTCSFCDYTTSSHQVMYKHYTKTHMLPPPEYLQDLVCKTRKRKLFDTSQIEEIKRHKRKIGAISKQIMCDECGSYVTDMQKHMNMHRGLKPYKCHHKNCMYATRYGHSLHLHIRNRHLNQPEESEVKLRKSHVCEHCNYKGTTKGRLDKHTVTKHSEEQIWEESTMPVTEKVFSTLVPGSELETTTVVSFPDGTKGEQQTVYMSDYEQQVEVTSEEPQHLQTQYVLALNQDSGEETYIPLGSNQEMAKELVVCAESGETYLKVFDNQENEVYVPVPGLSNVEAGQEVATVIEFQ